MYGQNVRIKRRGFKSRVTKNTPLRAARAKNSLKVLAGMRRQISSMSRAVETKENQWKTLVNIAYPHNNLTSIKDINGNPLNSFWMGNGSLDDGTGFNSKSNRIGDQITVRGVLFKLFIENALGRPKVFYDIMLIKSAKGDIADRSTLYKGNANNKMIDQIDKERYTIIARKKFTVQASNPAPDYANGLNGQPEADVSLGLYNAGMATKIVSIYVPGRKFGRGGNVTYENNSNTQVKFYDYRWYIMVYDWFGTPQDTNNVGRINEGYSKIYFKDA